MTEKININIPQKILFKAGQRAIARDLREHQPELRRNKRLASETAKIVATEAADPIDVRREGLQIIKRKAGAVAAVAGAAALLGVTYNHALENSPTLREKDPESTETQSYDENGQNVLTDNPNETTITVEAP